MAQPRVFFVHIMKTGGMSVGRVLQGQFPADTCYPNRLAGDGPDVKLFVDPLLSLDEAARARIRFYSVHMPAWLAEEVAPSHTRVTVVREPVRRTVSHLRHIARSAHTPDAIEEIYDDPAWRDRLTNYQTRILAPSRQDLEADREADRALAGAADEDFQARPAIEMQMFWLTGMTRPGVLDETDVARAVKRLERMDEVGLTEDLGSFVRRLERRLGVELAAIERVGGAGDSPQVSAALEARIRDDNALDAELYEYAVRRNRP